MNEGEGRITLKIDLSTGTIELDSPAMSFDQAIEKTRELAAALDLQSKAPAPAPSPQMSAPSAAAIGDSPQPNSRTRTRGSKSGARAGRIGSYEPVAGLLTEEQEIELRDFMAQKGPTEQSDRVLVAMVKGEQLLGRKGFVYNEIYTLMWLGGIKDLPKALDVVLGNMIQNQFVVRDGPGFSVKFVGRNRVDNDLPRKDGG